MTRDNQDIDVEKHKSSQTETNYECDDSSLDDPAVDKGFAWVVCFAGFLLCFSTWGATSAYGVFLNFYLQTNAIEGGSTLNFALLGGLTIFLGSILSPFVILSTTIFHPRYVCLTGTLFQTAGYILASFSTSMWQLYLTQGVVVGVSFSLMFYCATAVVPTWFDKKKATAFGIIVGGSGLGGLVVSLSVNKVIEETGNQKWALRMVGLMTLVLSLVACSVLKPRVDTRTGPLSTTLTWSYVGRYLKNLFDLKVLGSYPVILFHIWYPIVVLCFAIVTYTLAPYGSSVGLSQQQGSVLTALVNAMQFIGRPGIGVLGDKFGRVNVCVAAGTILCVFTLAFWITATTYSSLIPFSVLTGLVLGVASTMGQPLTTMVIEKQEHLPAAWASVNVAMSFMLLVSEVIAMALKQDASPKPYLHTQIFVGVCYFGTTVIMLFIRENLVKRALENQKNEQQLSSSVGFLARMFYPIAI